MTENEVYLQIFDYLSNKGLSFELVNKYALRLLKTMLFKGYRVKKNPIP